MPAINFDRQSLWFQALAIANLAMGDGLKLFHVFAHPLAVCLTPAPLQIGNNAFKGFGGLKAAHAIIIGKFNFFFAGAEQNHFLKFLWQFFPWGMRVNIVMLSQCQKGLGVIGALGFRPWGNCAFDQWLVAFRNNKAGIKYHLRAKPVTAGAGAKRIVKRKKPWLYLVNRKAGNWAGKFF